MTTGLRKKEKSTVVDNWSKEKGKKPTVVDNWSRKKEKSIVDDNWSKEERDKSTVDGNWSRDGTMPWYRAGVDFGYEENLFGDDRRNNCLLFFLHALCKLFMHRDNRYFFFYYRHGFIVI